MRVFVVRHAQPEVSPHTDPRQWPLSVQGRTAALALHGRLPETARWVASTELKAYDTLACARAGGPVRIHQDSRFDEVRRDEPFDGDFRARRRAWVEGLADERHAGWETPRQAAERFQAGVVAHTADTPLVLATHGMVLTAWLVHVVGAVAATEAGIYWEALDFPDVVEVDLAERSST